MSGLFLDAAVAERGVDLQFSVPPGEVLAVLGPNGSGKSTALQLIAGLLRPDRGVVRLGRHVLTDADSGTFVATHDRRVGLLMQDPLLFPHLSVAANVAFAPRRLHGRAQARNTALRWLDEVDATDLANRRPRQLSGGQAQRVAIARALAAEPDVLLLDEPMAGLDIAIAAALRGVLRRVLRRDGRCAILVTHDILDVLTLADRALVIEDGRVVEHGRAADVLAAPRSGFGARLANMNLISGTMAGASVLRDSDGRNWFGGPGEPLDVGTHAVAVFAPEAVSVFAEQPAGSPRNVIEVNIAEIDTHGGVIRLRAEPGGDGRPGIAADITAEAAAELAVTPGNRLWFAVKALEVAIHPAERS
jgi:molybdate transport system ATP-binding protein